MRKRCQTWAIDRNAFLGDTDCWSDDVGAAPRIRPKLAKTGTTTNGLAWAVETLGNDRSKVQGWQTSFRLLRSIARGFSLRWKLGSGRFPELFESTNAVALWLCGLCCCNSQLMQHRNMELCNAQTSRGLATTRCSHLRHLG